MIRSFRCRETAMIFKRKFSKKLPQAIQKLAYKKLLVLDVAEELVHLTVPPGNKLETLKDDRWGQHSIRINDQFRICFVWREHDVFDVEIVDYHPKS